MRTIFLAGLGAILLTFLFMSACSGDRDVDGWTRLDPDRISKTEDNQKHEAVRAKEALYANLASSIRSVMRDDGVESAIGTCRAEAPRLAEKIARERGLRIGRTSFKLRNPENAPPTWAERPIRRHLKEPAYFRGPTGEFGALLPIRLRPECMKCHGPESQIEPTVRRKITESYPDDRAMGFSTDDLRGWFWIEVPQRG